MNSIETLTALGYTADAIEIEGTECVQIIGSKRRWFYADSAAFAADRRSFMRDPDVSVAVLEFAVSDASPMSARFAAELVKLIAPADRVLKKYVRPLVRMTLTSVQAMYQTDTAHVGMTAEHRTLFEHGFAFPDANQYATATLQAACSNVLLDGEWLAQRSPLTVPRAELPVFNPDEMAPKLRALVDRCVAAGELRECGSYVAPPQDWSHEARLARQGVRIVPPTDDAPPPIQYNDERLAKAFGVKIGGTPTGAPATSAGNGFAAWRRG